MNIDAVREVLFWCTLLNSLFLAFYLLLFYFFKNWIKKVHGKMFTLNPGEINSSIYKMVGFYKILIIFFNVVPYIAISVVALSPIMR